MKGRRRGKRERENSTSSKNESVTDEKGTEILKDVTSTPDNCVERQSYDDVLEINRKKRCKSIDAKNMRSTWSSFGKKEGKEKLIPEVEVKWIPYAQNAMLNELVIANLMKFLSIKELANNRLVCKTWNYEAIKFIKMNHVLEIVDLGTRHTITMFVSSMKHSYVLPFTRFELRFEEEFPKKLPKSYRTFFFLYGGFINHLSLGFLTDSEINFSVHIFRNIVLLSVPNIISLSIDLPVATTSEPAIFIREKRIQFRRLKSILIQDFINDNDDSIHKNKGRYSSGFMSDLFKTAPSLEKFSLFTESCVLMERIVKSLDTLKMNNAPLTQLHLDGIVSEKDLNVLSEYQFRLRTVRIRCLKFDVTKRGLERFLGGHKKILEDLSIGDRCGYGQIGEDSRRFNLDFPHMEKLQVLKFVRRSGFTARMNGKLYLTTGFTQLPVLTKLAFDNDFPEPFHHLEDFFPRCETQCFNLKELDFCCELVDPAILLDIAKDYPEVSKLRLTHASNKFIQIICQHMVNIETLCLYLPEFERGKGYNIGSLCIQLDVRNCKAIRVLRSPREGFWFTVVFKKPAVGILRKIQKLEVETRNLRNCVHDVRVLTGFKDLTTLYFNRKLTQKYHRILSNHLPNVRIIEMI